MQDLTPGLLLDYLKNRGLEHPELFERFELGYAYREKWGRALIFVFLKTS